MTNMGISRGSSRRLDPCRACRDLAHDVDQGEEPPLVEREDGSWLVSGAASADLLATDSA